MILHLNSILILCTQQFCDITFNVYKFFHFQSSSVVLVNQNQY